VTAIAANVIVAKQYGLKMISQKGGFIRVFEKLIWTEFPRKW